ncbi:MAG: cystathionine beta-lyase [Pseudomonadota bacterium]
MSQTRTSLSNALVHLGRGPALKGRPVNLPIHQCSTLLFDSLAEFEKARTQRYERATLYYGRYGDPASFELEQMVAALEGGHGCVSLSSGLAAATIALMAATKAGDHILVADNVYGPTRGFCDTVLAQFGVEIAYFDSMNHEALVSLLRPNTSAIFFEAPGSGTFEVPDIKKISQIARSHGALSIIDGTWATPVFCRPLSLGADVVVHSGSKYICGHADAMIGFIVCNETTYEPMRKMALAIGDRAGAQDVFLSLRGLRTLEMRMNHAQAAGLEVAQWLVAQPAVIRMLHPAFESCPGHENWKQDFDGAAGLFGVILKPCSEAKLHAFVDALQMFSIGVSWGGYESLVLPVIPYRTAQQWNSPGHVLRFSIGMENTGDLIEDLARAMPLLD